MGQLNQDTLLIFIKNPIRGQVKTRLAATLGDDEALRIYKELLAHTRRESASIPYVKHLYYSHSINMDDEWDNETYRKFLQDEGDLGQRMANAFEQSFLTSRRVVIIGSDCPQLSTGIIRQAFDILLEYDTVIGPTFDQGYYLLGMASFHKFLFEDIPWSTTEVLPLTLEKCKKNKLTSYMLPILSDVDYEEDWKKFGW